MNNNENNIDLIIKFWGTRGSIPSPLTSQQIKEKQLFLIKDIISKGGTEKLFNNKIDENKIEEYLESLPIYISSTYGGDTTCIEIRGKDSPLLIIDAGTGIKDLGKEILTRLFLENNLNPLNTKEEYKQDLHLFFTHYHWDHIQGFPFFGPAFIGGNKKVNFYFYGKKDTRIRLSEVLKGQQQYPNFPVEWDDMPCSKKYIEINRLQSTKIEIGDLKITSQVLTHPDSVFAYKIEINRKKFVCATDTEHRDIPDPRLVKLALDSDVLYYDAQYTPEEYRGDPSSKLGAFSKFDWGHSTYEWGIKTALASNVKTLILGHHEPTRTDFELYEIEKKAKEFLDKELSLSFNKGKKLNIIIAYQGLEVKL